MKSDSARRKSFRAIGVVSFVAAFVLAGCGGRHIAAIPPGGNGTPAESEPTVSSTSNSGSTNASSGASARRGARPSETPGGSFEQGLASWYGLPFNGRRSANGEIYDMNKLTAAHRTLPFDTIVRVTNLDNGMQTEVRITDRGPFVEDRVIDLSYAAARAIGMVGTGTARVRLDIVASDASNFSESSSRNSPENASSPPVAAKRIQPSSDDAPDHIAPARPIVISSTAYFTVQVGAFGERANAERLKQRLDGRYKPVTIQDVDGANGRVYRVRVGNFATEDGARNFAQRLRESDGLRGMVVRQDETSAGGGEHE